MSTTAIRSKGATTDARVGKVDMKLEVITIPVSDVDRAKEFYGDLGWRLDADFSDGGERAVQFTPPGSQCSIHLGKNAPGPAQGIFLIVSDIEAARDDLVRRGVEVSEIFHFAKAPAPFGGRVSGIARAAVVRVDAHRPAKRAAVAVALREGVPRGQVIEVTQMHWAARDE